MGPRKDKTTRGATNSKRGKGRAPPPSTQQVGVLVLDLLLDEKIMTGILKNFSLRKMFLLNFTAHYGI
jgi:hypothetical protein